MKGTTLLLDGHRGERALHHRSRVLVLTSTRQSRVGRRGAIMTAMEIDDRVGSFGRCTNGICVYFALCSGVSRINNDLERIADHGKFCAGRSADSAPPGVTPYVEFCTNERSGGRNDR